MPLKLKKTLFSRNRDREKEFGDIFNKTSSGLSYIMTLTITVFFTPAMIATSIFSKELIVILVNLTLSLGYLSNFAYRLYNNEVSKAELIIAVLTLATFLTVAYFLCPPLAALSLINVLSFVNQMAITVNLFFLIKHVVVPPCKKIIENIAQFMGFNIAGRYYTKPPLTLTHDRYIIDQLLTKSYGHNSHSPEFKQSELAQFNKLLIKLSDYIDKYDESILGYIINKDAIVDLEKQIAQLTTRANTDTSYAFIRRKIGFKTTKIDMLHEAQKTITEALENPDSDMTPALHFFKGVDYRELERDRISVLYGGLECLQKEIERQQVKISTLEECLPPPRL